MSPVGPGNKIKIDRSGITLLHLILCNGRRQENVVTRKARLLLPNCHAEVAGYEKDRLATFRSPYRHSSWRQRGRKRPSPHARRRKAARPRWGRRALTTSSPDRNLRARPLFLRFRRCRTGLSQTHGSRPVFQIALERLLAFLPPFRLRARGFDLAEQPLETRQMLLVMAAQVMRQAAQRQTAVAFKHGGAHELLWSQPRK